MKSKSNLTYKIQHFFTKLYDLFYYDIPRFIKNIWRFRKLLWQHRWYDYSYNLLALRTSLEITLDGIRNGYEIEESRNKKIEKIQRVIQILKNIEEDNYLKLAEMQLGRKIIFHGIEFEPITGSNKLYKLVNNETPKERELNDEIYLLSHKLEKDEWEEFIQIIRGQDFTKFSDDVDFFAQFDGSGLKNWWE